MPRHINADKVMEEINRIGGHNLCEWETIGVKALIDRQPTADVVPKSEYDEVLSNWQKIHDSYTTDCIDHYNKGRTEVAREIFEEVDKLAKEGGVIWTHYAAAVLAELKKKYTEGEQDV